MSVFFRKNFSLFLINFYLLFSYLIIFPFFLNQYIREIYYHERIGPGSIEVESIIIFFLFLLFINIFYFIINKNKKINKILDKPSTKFNEIFFIIIFIIFYFIFFFIKSYFNNELLYFKYFTSLNTLSYLILILVFYRGLTSKNFLFKFIIFALVFFYILFVYKYISVNSKAIIFLSIIFLTILYYQISFFKILIIFLISLSLVVTFLIYENIYRPGNIEYLKNLDLELNYEEYEEKNNNLDLNEKTYQVLSRISQFHILNNIVKKIKHCDNSNYLVTSNNLKQYMWSENYRVNYIENLFNIIKNDRDYINKIESNNQFHPFYCFNDDCKKKFINRYFQDRCIKQDFIYGKFYSNSIIDFIPGSLHQYLKLPLMDTYGNAFGRSFSIIAFDDLYTGIAQNIIGDLFLNFGYFGIFFTLIISSFLKFYNFLISSRTLYMPIMCSFFPQILISIENSFIVFFTLSLKIFILVVIMFYTQRIIDLFSYYKINNFLK